MQPVAALLRYSEAALAAYADISIGQPYVRPLIAEGFAQAQAEQFASNWTPISSFEHEAEPYWIFDPTTGERIGPYTATNGLSATVFQNVATGERVLAIRGTDDVADKATDVVSILTLGSPKYQGQYQSLRTKVQEWIANGTLPPHSSVTGHSLGGFLATGLALEFPQYVDHAYLYNAPGLGGLTNRPVLDEIARIYHITGGAYDPSKFTNVRAKPGTSLVSGLGSHPSPPLLVEGEDHGGWLIGTDNHSINFLADSLAIHDAFTRLTGEDTLETAGCVIRGASDRELGKRAVFAPGCARMTEALADACEGADAVFFDGTLFTDDEMIRSGEGTKTGRRMGHMPMTGPGGAVEAFGQIRAGRKFFIHINNTNPALRYDSAERAALAAEGWAIAEDGMEISL